MTKKCPSLGPPPPGWHSMAGLAVAATLLASAADGAAAQQHDICIVGGGAGGLQLGQMLLNAERDFVLLEREAAAGSFYARFPVHRKLISLNKRNTGRDNEEFNMRHDWNSLLDTDSEHLFASLSVLLGFPVAHSGGPPLTSVRAPLQPRP